MAMVGVDDGSLQLGSQPKSVDLVWALAAAWHLVCIHQMNWVNSRIGRKWLIDWYASYWFIDSLIIFNVLTVYTEDLVKAESIQ